MDFTGERYVPSLTGEIYYEHVHRYAIAAPACSGKRVLDLASGEGWGSALLARYAADVVGIDIDADSIEHARRAYYVANLRFMTASATDIPLADGSIDVVTCFETIEHLSDHDRMLDEFKRVLVPNGTLFISSPNKLVYSDLAESQNPFHVRELYYQEFRDLLRRHFGNVEIYGQRFVSSSVLHPLSGLRSDDAGWYAGDISAIGDGMPTFAAPVYFVAVCSDGELYDRVASGFVDPRDDLYEHVRHELKALRGRLALEGLPPSREHGPDALAASSRLALNGGMLAGSDAAVIEDVEGALAEAREAHDAALAIERARADRAESLAQARADAVAATTAEHDAALAAERDARARLESELAAQRAEIAELGDALSERVTELTKLAGRCAAIELALGSSAAEQRRLEGRVAELVDRLQERDDALGERDEELEALKRALAEQVEEVGRRDALVAEREIAMAEYDAAVRRLDAALADREAHIAELSDAVRGRNVLLAARDQRLAELKRALAERTAEVSRRDALLADKDAALADYDATVRQRDAALADRDLRIAELEDAVATRGARIAALTAMAAERDALEGRIIELQARLAQERAGMVELRERAERDAMTLREILASRSWKMATMVRRAAGFVRGRRPA